MWIDPNQSEKMFSISFVVNRLNINTTQSVTSIRMNQNEFETNFLYSDSFGLV